VERKYRFGRARQHARIARLRCLQPRRGVAHALSELMEVLAKKRSMPGGATDCRSGRALCVGLQDNPLRGHPERIAVTAHRRRSSPRYRKVEVERFHCTRRESLLRWVPQTGDPALAKALRSNIAIDGIAAWGSRMGRGKTAYRFCSGNSTWCGQQDRCLATHAKSETGSRARDCAGSADAGAGVPHAQPSLP